MKTIETKTSSTAQNQIQAKRQSFFNKEGQGSFFSKSNEVSETFFNPTTVQPKLTIGQPNDKYEVEADTMADKVVQRLSQPESNITTNSSSITVQRKCSSCEEKQKLQKKEDDAVLENDIELQRKPIFESNAEQPDADIQSKAMTTPILQAKCASCEQEEKIQMKEEEEIFENGPALQRKPDDTPSENTSGLERRLSSSKGRGNSLPTELQTSMGSEFGADFSNVRVHTDSEAIQMSSDIGAQAFTHGSDIYFNQGKYDTNSNSGKHLLAHELTHTVQQEAASNDSAITPKIQKEDEPAGMTSTNAPMSVIASNQDQPLSFAQTLPSGQRIVCPVLPGAGAIIFRGIPLSSESNYLRFVLEEQVRQNGQDALTDYPNDFEQFIQDEIERLRGEDVPRSQEEQFAYDYYSSDTPGQYVSAGVPEQRFEHIGQEFEQMVRVHREILSELRVQAISVEQEISRLFIEFEIRAKHILATLLDESASRVEQEAIRYGVVDRYEDQSYHQYSVMTNSSTQGMQGAAQDILSAMEIYEEAYDDRYDENLGYTFPSVEHINNLNANLENAQVNLRMVKASAESRYPILGAFTREEGETSELRRIARGAGHAHLIGRTIDDRRSKIHKVREALRNNKIDVWKHLKIVQLSMADIGVQHNGMHSKVILENHEEHSRTPIIEWVLIGLALALGLLAAAPTGGGSLAIALSATAALGAAGINTYLLVEHLQEYEQQSNLSGTDFSLESSISQNSPSEFWIAVEIVGLGLDVGAAIQAFNRLAPLARQAAIAGEEGIQGINALRQSGEELKPGLGNRLANAASNLRSGGDEALNVAGAAGRSETRALARAGERMGEESAEVLTRVATRDGVRTVKLTRSGHVVMCLNPCGWMREVFSEALSENANFLRQVEEIEQMGVRLREGSFLHSETASSLRNSIKSHSEQVLRSLEDIEMARATGFMVADLSLQNLVRIARTDPSTARYLMARQLAISEEISTIRALEMLEEFGLSTNDLLRRAELLETRLSPEFAHTREARITEGTTEIFDEAPYAASTRNDPTIPNRASGINDAPRIDDPTITGDYGEFLTVGEYIPDANVQTMFTQLFSRSRRTQLRRILTDGGANPMTRFARSLGENGASQITLMTELGPRVVDYLRVSGTRALMVESKQVRHLRLNVGIRRQLLKDEWFLRQYPDFVLRWRVSGTISPEVREVFEQLAREYPGRFIYP